MHTFFSEDVLQVILVEDCVYDAAKKIANEYPKDCFHNLRLDDQEIYETQPTLLEFKE